MLTEIKKNMDIKRKEMKDKKRLNWNFQKWKYIVWNETNILEGIDSRLEAVEENVVKLEDNKSRSPNEVHRKNF